MLYFECVTQTSDSLFEYKKTMGLLCEQGYANWSAFDNFGSHLISTTDASQIISLMEYTWRGWNGHATRTMGYIDVLASKNTTQQIFLECLENYHQVISRIWVFIAPLRSDCFSFGDYETRVWKRTIGQLHVSAGAWTSFCYIACLIIDSLANLWVLWELWIDSQITIIIFCNSVREISFDQVPS